MSKYDGLCSCGEIKYSIEGVPKWLVACHCDWCQQLSGSAFRIQALFNESEVTFSGNTLSEYVGHNTEHGRINTNPFCFKYGFPVGIKLEAQSGKQLIN